jgi:hypothetical protein
MDVGNAKHAAQAKVEGKLSYLNHRAKLMDSVLGPLRGSAVMHPDCSSKYPRDPHPLERVSYRPLVLT